MLMKSKNVIIESHDSSSIVVAPPFCHFSVLATLAESLTSLMIVEQTLVLHPAPQIKPAVSKGSLTNLCASII